MAALGLLREPFSAISHGIGAVIALFATIYLVFQARARPGSKLACVIYGICLVFCLGSSFAFHGANVSDEVLKELLDLDHIGILLLIAGSYTPIAWSRFEGNWRPGTLIGVWSLAGMGALLYLCTENPPIILSTMIYLGMGWAALLCFGEIKKRAPQGSQNLLILGGLLYSIGAVINLLGLPYAPSGTAIPHGIFHMFVLAGAATHFIVVLRSSQHAPAALRRFIRRPDQFRFRRIKKSRLVIEPRSDDHR